MITNTKTNDPLINLVQSLPGGIEAQERQGQHEVVNSSVLPIRGYKRADMEARGVTFGEAVKGDDLFVHVTLPPGWEKRATDHDLWTDLVDADGVKVASIFYKAAFYDRDAFLNLCKTAQEGE